MSCPTCSHTMQTIQTLPHVSHYWCPRCGTLTTSTRLAASESFDDNWRPYLVARCQNLDNRLKSKSQGRFELLDQVGIIEAIYLPENRK